MPFFAQEDYQCGPAALATVQRFEADSKFFRSLVVVLLLLGVWGIGRAFYIGDLASSRRDPAVLAGLLALCLAPLAFWRFAEQRGKATTQAYWYAITLAADQDGAPQSSPEPRADAPTHAGGVVYSAASGDVRYLVVRATSEDEEWVLPKGHIEPGETPREAAVREVREEAGVWGEREDRLGTHGVRGSRRDGAGPVLSDGILDGGKAVRPSAQAQMAFVGKCGGGAKAS